MIGSDLVRARTREGMAVAKARTGSAASSTKLDPQPVALWQAGNHTLAGMYDVARSTVYRVIQRVGRPQRLGPNRHHSLLSPFTRGWRSFASSGPR